MQKIGYVSPRPVWRASTEQTETKWHSGVLKPRCLSFFGLKFNRLQNLSGRSTAYAFVLTAAFQIEQLKPRPRVFFED